MTDNALCLPWRRIQTPVSIRSKAMLYAGKGFAVVDCMPQSIYGGDPFERADFVLRACNSHDDLVAALEAFIHQRDYYAEHGHYDKHTPHPEDDQLFDDWAADIAETVLAKAKGEA